MTDTDGKKYPECQPSMLCKYCDYDFECGDIMMAERTSLEKHRKRSI
ncbi:MAG TPA: hypothetical protein VMW50_02955 [Dehalococcoidia bacterium]|nr:hypothetical protein [Dehalococcoidia bacterium]